MSVFNQGREVNAFEVVPDDPMFLQPDEHTFLFFGASHSVVRMLAGKRENYTAGTINFKEVSLRPSDLIGNRCSHSKKVVNEIHTACVGIHQNHVKYLFHEAEFADWFAAQDKEKLKPYRFVRPRKKTLIVEGSSFELQINNGEKVSEYTFEALSEIPYSSVAAMAGGESRVDPAGAGAGGLGSLVAAPSMAPTAVRPGGGQPEGVDTGWRGGGASVSPGMTDPGSRPQLMMSSAAGMTMAGEAVIPGAGAGTAGAPLTGAGPTTQTVVMCPHCTHPIMFSFKASKIGE